MTVDIRKVLEETGAMLRGHFLLTSGRHSDRYIEKFRLLEQPQALDDAARAMIGTITPQQVDVVLGAATGGILLAGAVSRQLGRRTMFTERVEGEMTLRRGFALQPGEKVLIVEDIVSTGGSIAELIDIVQQAQAEVVLAVCLAVTVFFAFGLPMMKPNVQILKLFDANSRIIADYRWLEENLGNLVPMEVVISVSASRMAENHMPDGETEALGKTNVRGDRAYYDAQGNYLLNFLDRIELAMRLQQRVESLTNIDRAMSAATFYPHEPEFDVTRLGWIIPLSADSKQRLRRKKLNQRLTESRQEYLDTDYLRQVPATGAELWR
ncbi:MAG: orotate phosphoribosyltransferase, partial [Candidatus Marinimicrobia bacterium]|nr:orotate phosphoribosyltransferase [Candidatus Neomarinimicrobiota bacterium]